MIKLAERGLDTFIVDQVTKGKPILGICLGMQVLFDVGNEFNRAAGLGLLPGEVRQIRTHHKLPHIGWNSLNFTNNSKLLDGIPEDSFVYFVHSYICECSNPQDVVATANYGENVTAIVQRGHIIGCQFHPEKSGSLGLRIYDNFAGL
jgi:glutamine amidotransferase